MKSNYTSFEERVENIMNEYVLIPYTNSSRLFSTVRRMKAEKELRVPIKHRAEFVISTKTGRRANEMNESEWEEFYNDLCRDLKNNYPELYNQLFDPEERFCNRCGVKMKDHYHGWWMVCGWSGLYGEHNTTS